jgi:Cu/Ag efflux protein CusF
MKIAKIVLAGTAAFFIVGSAALAQQAGTGVVTEIDRIHGTISIRQTPGGTVGANGGTAAEIFKVQDSAVLEDVHAGDQVSFSAAEAGGKKTITKLQRQ